jgi:hypothetical protein
MKNQGSTTKQTMTTKRNAVWLSFDLGIQGDYEGLYSWLDMHSAVECGDSLAFLNYAHKGDLVETLKSDLEKSVKTDRRSRIYIIYLEPMSKKMKGKFLFGKRKGAAWAGYGPQDEDTEDNA